MVVDLSEEDMEVDVPSQVGDAEMADEDEGSAGDSVAGDDGDSDAAMEGDGGDGADRDDDDVLLSIRHGRLLQTFADLPRPVQVQNSRPVVHCCMRRQAV